MVNQYIDIKLLAEEYEKIMSMSYGFMLENDEMISFRFGKRRFYHLLGFHYLTYAIADKLLVYDYIDKKDFFDFVRSGKISFDNIELDKIIENSNKRDKFINTIKSELKESDYIERNYDSAQNDHLADLQSIIVDRWNCFSVETVMEIFGEEIVLDYENTEGEDIKGAANKIFFRFLEDKSRHLNFIVGFNEIEKKYYPMSFFLEAKRGKFFYKDDGSEQEKLKILVKFKYDANTGKLQETSINWNVIRVQLILASEIDVLSNLATIEKFKGQKVVTSNDIKKLLVDEKRNQISEVPKIYEQMEDKEKALKFLERYQKLKNCNAQEEETIILAFYDDDIEIDNEVVQGMFEADYKHKFLKQYTKYVGFYNTISQMEIREVKFIYGKFFDVSNEQWSDDFVKELIDEHSCYENDLSLETIGKMINQAPNINSVTS